jgi:hypothetical protein
MLRNALIRHCGCGGTLHPTTTSRLPQFFAALPIPQRLTSECGQNGPALYGMRWNTSRIPNHWTSSSSGRAASTNARLGLPVIWGDLDNRQPAADVEVDGATCFERVTDKVPFPRAALTFCIRSEVARTVSIGEFGTNLSGSYRISSRMLLPLFRRQYPVRCNVRVYLQSIL